MLLFVCLFVLLVLFVLTGLISRLSHPGQMVLVPRRSLCTFCKRTLVTTCKLSSGCGTMHPTAPRSTWRSRSDPSCLSQLFAPTVVEVSSKTRSFACLFLLVCFCLFVFACLFLLVCFCLFVFACLFLLVCFCLFVFACLFLLVCFCLFVGSFL